MQKGNVNSVLKLLTENMHNGILPLNDDTIQKLRQKHPAPKKASNTVMLPDEPKKIHNIIVEKINVEIIQTAVMRTREVEVVPREWMLMVGG